MMTVRLSWMEMLMGGLAGLMRTIRSVTKGYDTAGAATDALRWGRDILGAMAELAYSRASGQFWGGSLDTFKAPDVGTVQVRATEIPDGSLIVREADPDGDIYVLVIARPPDFRVVGMIHGRAAKRPEFLRAPAGRPPAWFVPQSALEPAGEEVRR